MKTNAMRSRSADTAQKVKALTDKLEAGVKEVFESEQYKAYMKAMAKFHQYSFNNVMLILMQCPNASAVMGYATWERQFGRTVKNGESGIQIIAPTSYKRIVETVTLDPVTNMPILDADGEPVKEKQYVVQRGYKIAYVFDVSQTVGRELPSYGVNELHGSVQNYDTMLNAVLELAPVPVIFREPDGDARGCYVHSERRIYLNRGMSHIDTISILIHETAHAMLHALPVKDGVVVGRPEKNRRTREVEAESIAYVVCQHFGIETGDSSFAYITGWSKDKELDELKASLDCISKTSAKMIDEIEAKLPDMKITFEKSARKKDCVSR